jgi:hypothetical protein
MTLRQNIYISANGIINLLGPELFMDVFHLQSKESVVDTSLTFVVDVTGSMATFIDAVIASLTTIVTNSRSLEFIPSKYVLVTFSDPGPKIRPKRIF